MSKQTRPRPHAQRRWPPRRHADGLMPSVNGNQASVIWAGIRGSRRAWRTCAFCESARQHAGAGWTLAALAFAQSRACRCPGPHDPFPSGRGRADPLAFYRGQLSLTGGSARALIAHCDRPARKAPMSAFVAKGSRRSSRTGRSFRRRCTGATLRRAESKAIVRAGDSELVDPAVRIVGCRLFDDV